MEIEQREAALGLELDVSEEQVVAHRHPDLGKDGVLRGAQEGLDLEVALDPLEENLDLPAGLVDGRDGGGGQVEDVGEELEIAARLGVKVADEPQGIGEVPAGLERVRFDDEVKNNAFVFRGFQLSGKATREVLLGPGDEEGASVVNPTERSLHSSTWEPAKQPAC